MSKESTAKILNQLRADDKTALQSLFHQHYAEVCRAVYRLIPDQAHCEDLAQNVFIRIWEKRQHLEINTSFGAYLHRMGVNEALSYLRKEQRREEKKDDIILMPVASAFKSKDGEAQMIQKELGQQINRAIEALPPRCRDIFKLSRYEGLSYREIAERLDISIKTVEHQMGKALKLLRGALRQYLGFLLIALLL